MTRHELIESFATGPARFQAALEPLPREMWQFKPSPTAWSVHEIIIHMPDSEASAYVRCRKIIAESGVSVDVYDQDLWAARLHYHELSTDTALTLFRALRAMTVEVLRNVEATTWNNHINHPEDGRVTLERWLEMYSRHVDKHISQMQRNLEAWRKAGSPDRRV